MSSSKIVEAVKTSVCDGELDLLEAMDWDEAGSFEKHLDVIEACFWKDRVEDIFLALESVPGTSASHEWARAQLAALKTKSPRTLKVAHRQLRAGLDMKTFEDNMRMEFRIGCRQVHSHDFQEGVRAVIVDKDNKPNWTPATLAGVTPQDARRDFRPAGRRRTDVRLRGELRIGAGEMGRFIRHSLFAIRQTPI